LNHYGSEVRCLLKQALIALVCPENKKLPHYNSNKPKLKQK